VDTSRTLFEKSPDLGSAQFRGVAKALYNFGSFSPYFAKLDFKETSENGKTVISVDEAKSAAAINKIPPRIRDWVLQAANSYMGVFAGQPFSPEEIEKYPPAILLKMLHPGLKLSDALKAEMKQAEGNVAVIKGLSPMERAVFLRPSTASNLAIAQKHVEDSSVNENEAREIITFNYNYKTLNMFLRNPESPFVRAPTPPIEEVVRSLGGTKGIDDIFNRDQLAHRDAEASELFSCKMTYYLNKHLLPNPAQIKTLKSDIERSRQLVNDVIRAKFPPSVQLKLIQAVDNSDFSLPPTASEFEQLFIGNLRQILATQKAHNEDIARLSPEDLRQLFVVEAFRKNRNRDQDPTDFCDAFFYAPVADANVTAAGSIIVSYTTVTGPENARLLVISHELGHSIYKVIAEDPSFDGVRKCLKERHTEDLPPLTKKAYQSAAEPKTFPYLNEDFSDSVYGESDKAVRKGNPWCHLLDLSPDRQLYDQSSMQSLDGDTHSSILFRLLNFQSLQTGTVPDSCQKYLTSVKFTEHFRACLDLANVKPDADAARSAK